MMPELGKYAGTVLAAYGVSIVLLGGLTVLSVLRARKVREDLRRIEAGRRERSE
ncbi:heme exporter protein CcmD [Amaricoccus tamworthensis]|uniref:heme exporter protein CcmD n=1 Tax=Amaricoccus tamworthensis TaxID=57002 RepID=UPI003C7A8D5E